jgi:DNA polymerase-3 subunit alpha
LSGQPLDEYRPYLKALPLIPFQEVAQSKDTVITCGMVKMTKVITTKKGDPMAFMQLEDYSGKAEVVIFSKLYSRVQSWLKEYSVFVVKGTPDQQIDQGCKIKAMDIIPLDLIISEGMSINSIMLIVPEGLQPTLLNSVKQHLVAGTIPLTLCYKDNGQWLKITSKSKVSITPQLMHSVKTIGLQIKLNL